MNFRSGGDRFGSHRVVTPKGSLPQQAEKLEASLPIFQSEMLIEVESLNIDSSSFHQMKSVCGGDPEKLKQHILQLVSTQGKQQNPVTGSGGMLIGKVAEIGPQFLEGKLPSEKVSVGDRVATLVSLTLTPLHIQEIKKIHMDLDRVDICGHAIMFQSGIYSKLPTDISEVTALAVLDVAGAPAHTAEICKPGQTVVLIGGGGKSGLLSAYAAKKQVGASGKVIALDYSAESLELARQMSFIDVVEKCDARDAVGVYELVKKITVGKLADVVINVTNIPNTEMSCILATRPKGVVYFFSTATSFNKAALGAEGVGADLHLMIGNGYCPGHAEYALQILRESKELRSLYQKKYGSS